MANHSHSNGFGSKNELFPDALTAAELDNADTLGGLSVGTKTKTYLPVGESHLQLDTTYELNSGTGWIEQAGNTGVYKTNAGNYYAYDGNNYNQIDSFQDSGGWSIIGAENINGSNQVAFHHASSNQFYKWNTNSNWDFLSGELLTGNELLQAETNFDQDFNSDGITGSPLTTAESAGSIELLKDSAGYGYAQDSAGNSFSITHTNGTHWGDSTWSMWTLAGAETTNGINTSAWINSSGQLWFAQHDSNWAYTNSGGYADVGSSAHSQAEINFGQDFNGDQSIGILDQDQKSFL